MAESERADTIRKWCPLCGEWKVASVLVSESKDTELVESTRQIIYCPECGAMLREDAE
jgi:formate dehydrogenase maturation protein FdhE